MVDNYFEESTNSGYDSFFRKLPRVRLDCKLFLMLNHRTWKNNMNANVNILRIYERRYFWLQQYVDIGAALLFSFRLEVREGYWHLKMLLPEPPHVSFNDFFCSCNTKKVTPHISSPAFLPHRYTFRERQSKIMATINRSSNRTNQFG